MTTITKVALMAGLFALLSSALGRAEVVKPSAAALAAAGPVLDVAAWDALLKSYDDGAGRVDYQRLKSTPANLATFERLYAEVGKQKLDGMSPAAREAFLLDAYNICVWRGVLDRLPGLKSVGDSTFKQIGFFATTKYVVAGKEISLRDLENDWIRKQFKDPRVHMALNCASAGCPLLPREAFTATKLDEQLDREVRRFVGEERNVHLDEASKTVTLSKIFDWYSADFAKEPIAWINKYRAEGQQIPAGWKVKFTDYDWRLNDPSLKR